MKKRKFITTMLGGLRQLWGVTASTTPPIDMQREALHPGRRGERSAERDRSRWLTFHNPAAQEGFIKELAELPTDAKEDRERIAALIPFKPYRRKSPRAVEIKRAERAARAAARSGAPRRVAVPVEAPVGPMVLQHGDLLVESAQ